MTMQPQTQKMPTSSSEKPRLPKKVPKNARWIFFDFDGTLVNSLPVMYQTYCNFLEGFGKKGTREEFEELNGPALPEIVSYLKTQHKLADNEQTLNDLYIKQVSDVYRNHVKPMDGAGSALKILKNNAYDLFLVTSARSEIANEYIQMQGWGQYFVGYIFGDDVKEGKPSPEIYQFALKKAKTSSETVIVVEDSYNGVRSAKSVGVFVIGLASNQSKEVLLKAGANIVVSKLEEILLILEDRND